jgi:hypothetical protein
LSIAINGGASQLASHSPGPKLIVIGDFVGQPIIIGGRLSTTVITARQVPTFPHSSVVDNVTLFGPMLAQVNEVRLAVTTNNALGVQLSETLWVICDGVIIALPASSRFTVMFLQTTKGTVLSKTVITWLQVPEFPQASVER